MTTTEKLWAEYLRLTRECDRHDAEGRRLYVAKDLAFKAFYEHDPTHPQEQSDGCA